MMSWVHTEKIEWSFIEVKSWMFVKILKRIMASMPMTISKSPTRVVFVLSTSTQNIIPEAINRILKGQTGMTNTR